MGSIPQSETFVLSYNRPELLACTLASICGFNGSAGPVHVIDDGSADPRVMRLLAGYREEGLIESVEHGAHRGVGVTRRRMIDRFLESGAEQLVQVEADMIVAPGAIAALAEAARALKAAGHKTGIVNTHVHHWCHRVTEYKDIGGYRVALARSGSEPFWTADREALASNLDALPQDRPDLVLFLQRLGCTSIISPEISCQHLGAGKCSVYYPEFHWSHVVYHSDNERSRDLGPIRKPYSFLSYDFEAWQRTYPACFREAYELFRRASPIYLPECPA